MAEKVTTILVDVATPIRDAERRLILATLDHYDGNKVHAALSLGIALKLLPQARPLSAGGRVSNALYRHFDANEKLLYVGISINVIARQATHRIDSHWFYRIARIDIEYYDNRDAALAAERKAILEESPEFNIQGRPVIHSILAKLPTDYADQAIGYIQSLILMDFQGAGSPSLPVLSWEHARGIADALWQAGSYGETGHVADQLCDHGKIDLELLEKLLIGVMPVPRKHGDEN